MGQGTRQWSADDAESIIVVGPGICFPLESYPRPPPGSWPFLPYSLSYHRHKRALTSALMLICQLSCKRLHQATLNSSHPTTLLFSLELLELSYQESKRALHPHLHPHTPTSTHPTNTNCHFPHLSLSHLHRPQATPIQSTLLSLAPSESLAPACLPPWKCPLDLVKVLCPPVFGCPDAQGESLVNLAPL